MRPSRQLGLAIVVLALAAAPMVHHFLVAWPGDQWQVDAEVYREAARSIVYGRPIYDQLTESPQLLPFTYPPFAALLALWTVVLPFHVVGWMWAVLQVAATYLTVLVVFRRLLDRVPGHRLVAAALLTAPVLYLEPVTDGVRFGQVNAFLVLACTADLVARRRRRGAGPQGVWIGLATAVKLTPGVFLVHLAVCRRWRELRCAVLALAAATIGAFLVLPEASLAFWGGALGDPSRLGPNRGTPNQSIRGLLLRIGPQGTAGSLVWLLLVAVVAVVGFRLARRAWRAGDPVAEVAVVGMLAVLLSPVAWIHHFAWVVVVLAALVGDGTSRRRWAYAGVVAVWFWCRGPWWGVAWLHHHVPPEWFGRVLQNSDVGGGVLALVLLSRVIGSGVPADPAAPAGEPAVADRVEQAHA